MGLGNPQPSLVVSWLIIMGKIMIMEDQRRCTVCGETRPVEEFFLYGAEGDRRRLSVVCNTCEAQRRRVAINPQKRCRTCEQIKPVEEFNYSHADKGYRRHDCRTCERARHATWRAKNSEAVREQMKANYERRKQEFKHDEAQRARSTRLARRHRERLRDQIFAAYGSECTCCGETEPLFLSIDHVNNDGYAHRKLGINNTVSLFSMIRRLGFPKDDFQLLCMNCNHGKYRNKGVCPHKEGSTTIPEGSTAKRPEAPHPSEAG